MLQFLNQRRGQTTLEYAVLIVVIIGALISIQVYMKRGVQGRLKQATDDIGSQYSEGNTNSIKTVIRNSHTQETFNAGTSSSRMLDPEKTRTTENTIILNTAQEYWGSEPATK